MLGKKTGAERKGLKQGNTKLDSKENLPNENDEYFSEFTKKDKLKTITGFDGSFGLAVILKKKLSFCWW